MNIRKRVLIANIVILVFILFLRPVMSQGSNEYGLYYNKANSMLISGNFKEAINMYNKALQYNPNSSDAYLGLGIAYKEAGRYPEAYNSTMKAIQINPNYYQAYYNLGIILEKMNRYDEAIDAYEKFLREVPGAERFSDAKQRIAMIKKKYK